MGAELEAQRSAVARQEATAHATASAQRITALEASLAAAHDQAARKAAQARGDNRNVSLVVPAWHGILCAFWGQPVRSLPVHQTCFNKFVQVK